MRHMLNEYHPWVASKTQGHSGHSARAKYIMPMPARGNSRQRLSWECWLLMAFNCFPSIALVKCVPVERNPLFSIGLCRPTLGFSSKSDNSRAGKRTQFSLTPAGRPCVRAAPAAVSPAAHFSARSHWINCTHGPAAVLHCARPRPDRYLHLAAAVGHTTAEIYRWMEKRRDEKKKS